MFHEVMVLNEIFQLGISANIFTKLHTKSPVRVQSASFIFIENTLSTQQPIDRKIAFCQKPLPTYAKEYSN